MDVAGQPGQRLAFGFRCGRRRAHPRQLPRQQHENHAQVAHDRQQQPAQAFGRALRRPLRMQRPHLLGRLLAVDQPLQLGRQLRAPLRPQRGIDPRQLEPQRRRLGPRVATEHAEQVQHVGAFDLIHHAGGAGIQRVGQHRRQRAGAVAPRLQAGDGDGNGLNHETIFLIERPAVPQALRSLRLEGMFRQCLARDQLTAQNRRSPAAGRLKDSQP